MRVAQEGVQVRGGRVACRAACALLGVSLSLASTVAFAGPGASGAFAAGAGRVPLPGHQGAVPPGATLIGPAPQANTLPLVVTFRPPNPAALAAEVRAVSDPRSPDYHRFLTPAQFAQQFGPSPGAIAQVVSALRREGLTVGTPSSTGLSVPVTGTVAQVQSAFSTGIDRYRLASGKTGYDNRSAPEVPASVAPQIQGILGLDTLSPPQPSSGLPQPSSIRPHAGSVAPALAPGQPSPQPGTCATVIGNVQSGTGALNAVQLAQAYSFGPLYSSNHYGAGSTVALVEMSGAGYSTSDISTFANCYGISLAGGQITQKVVDGGGATGDATMEAELDIDNVISLAPKANIQVYEGGPSDGIYNVVNRIVGDDTAKIVSVSWTNGCEAYLPKSYQSSENTLFQAAATEGQSVFIASGDQGAQGCNINRAISATTGTDPVAQTVDPTTGTLYVANKSSNTISVDSEGNASNPSNFVTAGSVSTGSGSGPDAVTLDSSVGKVFVANANSTLTVFSTSNCNRSTTAGCTAPTRVASGGHLSGPAAIVANGSTLYVANSNGTVAVYNASTNAYVTSVTLPPLTAPTALAVDVTNGAVYLADGVGGRIEYFNAATCNAATTSGCSAVPATVTVGLDPVALAVATNAGDLYVANAGPGGGISVVSLSTHTVVATISTSQPSNGTGVVQSIGMSPDNHEVLAVLNGLNFPGDVMATVDPSTQSITSTVGLETGSDTMGQLVSDGTLGYAWVTDETNGGDVVQNLNLAVSDPASQPYVTSVGGTTVTALGPAPTEKVWNDRLFYSDGAGGGGISETYAMPAYQQALGTVSGSSGTPCANASGNCREVPDVSADADPSTGYVIYDSVNGFGWNALGGTSGAAPLWAAVLAVAASADGNTGGYGALNPALYLLAQNSPGTYLNDVTSGNNDYNATSGGQYPATTGYDMATGLGTPVASQLATGLVGIPLNVVVSGTQAFGGSPTFTALANYGGVPGLPSGITLNTTGFSCTTVGDSTPIGPTLVPGGYTLLPTSCSGATLSGANSAYYSIVYTSAANDFTVTLGSVNVAVAGTQTYGGTPSFSGGASPPSGITVNTDGLACTYVDTPILKPIAPTLPAGTTSLVPLSCSGVTLSGANAADYSVVYTSTSTDFTVTPAPLTITASSPTMTYGGSVPTITPGYAGFVNGETTSSLTAKPTCATTATISSPVLAGPYASSCGGAVDSNYSFSYVGGSVTVNPAALTVTASSGSMTYGATVSTITPGYAGFVNGDTTSSLTTKPVCSTTATSASPPSPPTYPSSCSGGSDANYAFAYVNGATTVTKAPIAVAVRGTQANMGSPSFSGSGNPPAGVTLTTSALTCTEVTPSTPITVNLASGAYTLLASSCSGIVLAGTNAGDYSVTLTSASGDFTVTGGPPPVSPPPPQPPPPATHGYWLVGSDGGIFTFGSASFYGSTGSLTLQRPVVGITSTRDRAGYWLVASDGGTFAFGDAGFYGSIPGLGLAPAGSGLPHSLNAPIVAMVPAADGQGYFVVASDGGVFAFGPGASFAGSCPGIGGCSGPAVSVIPDSTGNGYWLFTATGNVYSFGDAPSLGSPGNVGSPITSAVRTPDGKGYWVLVANGTVYRYGDAVDYGSPSGQFGAFNPATAIFSTSDGGGYWVASAVGAVDPYGDAPNDGGMAGTHLNGSIIAATGF